MKNIIEFYYNINIDELHNKNDYYYFYINNNYYIFKLYQDDINRSNDIYNLNIYIINYINIDKIILNKYNSSTTKVKDDYYILILKRNNNNNNNNNNISLYNIMNMSSIQINQNNIKLLERNNWELLWSNMIDYFELQIGENDKKYPLLRESFDYFIGLTENAISYLVNTKREVKKEITDTMVISHNNLFTSIYDPVNIILDHRGRDVAEYIKLSFYYNNSNIFNELDEYFKYNYYSVYGIRVLLARILYPSFYFKLYNDIILGKKEENEINTIISRINAYENYLYDVYLYFKKFYDIPIPEWIKKQGIIPR